ncbi:MAG TPA: hypothetical protein VF789_24310 [Thermoanaerobaculia bacterium]
MARARLFLFLVFLAALLTPSELGGQASPASKQFEVAPPRTSPWPSATHHHWGPAVVELGSAGFASSWATYFTTTDPHDYDRLSDSVTGKWLSPEGAPGSLFLASTEVGSPGGVGEPSLARIGADRFVAVMCQYRDLGSDIWFRRFDAHHALDEESRVLGDIPDFRLDCGPSVASNDAGRFVIAWIRVVDQWSERAAWRPMAQVFDADGEPVTPEIEVSPPSPGTQETRPAVGIDADGNFTVLWQSYGHTSGAGTPPGTWGQRFDPNGNLLGERFRVGGTPGIGGIAMTMAPSGGFVASWGERAAAGRTARRMRRFLRTGQGVGLLLSIPGDVRQTWEPSLDRDRYGNVALFWIEGRRAALALFNKDLIRQGPIVYDPPATLLTGLPNTSGDSVVLTDDGRIFTVWLGPRARKARDSILGRIWRARKEADLCFFNRNVYSCDTANDGGGAEQRPFVMVQRGVANDPDARPVAGDFDSDGRDELCVAQGRRVYCDVDHDNFMAEAASDPFLFELAPTDEAAVGDVDGDRRADVCVRRDSVWYCDVRQGDGIAPDFTFELVAGEGAMIGDVDADGRAEPCVASGARFLCDTAHNGGLAETVLDLKPVLPRGFGGVPLLGDVDGDGKDDPCLFGNGRLICGLFNRKPGLPPRAFELRMAGDGVPVLADIDAF